MTADRRMSAEFADAARQRAQAQWDDPERRRRHGELVRVAMASPAVRDCISERTKAAHNVPGMRERKYAGLVAAFADPALRRKISERTREGIAAKAARDLAALRAAWEAAPKAARLKLLAAIATPRTAPEAAR